MNFLLNFEIVDVVAILQYRINQVSLKYQCYLFIMKKFHLYTWMWYYNIEIIFNKTELFKKPDEQFYKNILHFQSNNFRNTKDVIHTFMTSLN